MTLPQIGLRPIFMPHLNTKIPANSFSTFPLIQSRIIENALVWNLLPGAKLALMPGITMYAFIVKEINHGNPNTRYYTGTFDHRVYI